jgi:phosphocarrier protein HPr
VQVVRVLNQLGLHTRPATAIVKLIQYVKSEVSFTYKQETVSAKSVLGILTLAVPKDANIVVTVEGEDAKETMRQLINAFENQFGE